MAIRRRNIDFESTEDAALLYLYAAFDSENSMWCTTREINDGIVDANFNEVSMALTTLIDRGLVDKDMRDARASPITTPTVRQRLEFCITRAGIDVVMTWTEERLSQSELKLEAVNSVELEAEEDSVTPERNRSEAPNVDGWEPLPLERAGTDYEAAVNATEAALSEISGNNGYAESEPEERERIVWSLSEAVRQMRGGIPSRDQILVMAVKPLKYIADKFSGASMGEAAKAAVKAIWIWLSDG